MNAKLVYQKKLNDINLQLTTGFEFLSNHSNVDDYGNRNGVQDTIQYKDVFFANQSFAFSQFLVSFKKMNISAGISANNQSFKYKRSTDPNQDYKYKATDVTLMPRLAASYGLNRSLTLYALVARGYSPPSLAEVSPSNTTINTSLQAENGWDAELGLKGNLFKGKLMLDVNYYSFRLKDAIVNRSNPDGSQYFINAGNTKQDGLELWLRYFVIRDALGFLKNIQVAASHSYQPYRFINYTQANNIYDNNKLTGVPENISVATLTVETINNFFLNGMYNHTAAIPLSDANDAFVSSYNLLQARIGWKGTMSKASIELYIGADNLLNELYSLGNDINALGKRYYNPAPPRNYQIGCGIAW